MTVRELRVYPVKSLGVVSLDSAVVDPRGFLFDRRWMVVDADGVFMSQRSTPLMSRFSVHIASDGLRLARPSGDSVLIPFEATGETIEVRVWHSAVSARRVGQGADDWLSSALGTRCSLVAFSAESERPVRPDFGQEGDAVSFADAFPILVANMASLQDLNRRLGEPIGIERFRPNIVVEGFGPWEEDGWSQVRIGEVLFRVAKACGRCSVTTIDPATGETGVEPLRTLATFRQFGQAVTFGVYLIPDGVGTIRVGNRFVV